ncbi:hypothetical protein Patl1_14462 [Pistacia atlantica]|uniref:Uncharacterized protein n=1 Tax=Pistacia atlantica TaxID=434234 RepID=A0ACC1AWZ4_9ROSI|nr:hypothetical protein Patl1_14462 [Pistacia atlantica]
MRSIHGLERKKNHRPKFSICPQPQLNYEQSSLPTQKHSKTKLGSPDNQKITAPGSPQSQQPESKNIDQFHKNKGKTEIKTWTTPPNTTQTTVHLTKHPTSPLQRIQHPNYSPNPYLIFFPQAKKEPSPTSQPHRERANRLVVPETRKIENTSNLPTPQRERKQTDQSFQLLQRQRTKIGKKPKDTVFSFFLLTKSTVRDTCQAPYIKLLYCPSANGNS